MPNNDSHQHVVKTSAQWNDRAVEYWVVPRGCLCVELTSRGKTKLKVGEGNKYYAQLPYICDIEDLSDYYTKEEINNLFNNLNRMAIMSTREYDEKSDLPLTGNKLGDVRFVKSSSPSLKLDPDVYLWNGHKWIFVGYDIIDIDLSQYIKREEFEPVAAKVDEMYPKMHTHENMETLDRIEEPYTTAEKDKLEGLENYDDTEIRSLIRQATHVHPNKSILDQIQQPFKNADKAKLDSLENYDDTELRDRISDVEAVAHTHSNKDELDLIYSGFVNEHQVLVEFKTVAEEEIDNLNADVDDLKTKIHTHSNKNILDSTTAPYTTQDKATLDELAAITIFDGAGPTYDGFRGYVPAPLAGQQSYFLRGDGTWAKVKGGGDKYKAGEGIYILSGEATSDTFPFNVYSRAVTLKQYIIYGNVGGVGNLVDGHYQIPVIVSAPGHPNRTSTIVIDDPMYDGDYIDFERQVFAHYRTDITSQVQHPSTDTIQQGISSTGNIYYKSSYQGWSGSPRLTDYFEIDPTASYEISPVHSDSDFSDSLNINVYDENQNRTRTIITSTTDATLFVPMSGEKYIRQSYVNGTGKISLLQPVETPCVLQNVVLYPNAINTIDVGTTIKPSEIYVEVDEPIDPDPDDPMSEYTGIIYNDGVLDVTQEDPNALNELTVHFRESSKVLTIPNSSYTLPVATDSTLGGIIVGDGLEVDQDGVLDTIPYEAGVGLSLGTPYTHNLNTDIPETYLQVEYLESTGTQYINTGQRYDTAYYHYEVDCEIDDENNNQIFGMKYWYDHSIDIYDGIYQACDSSSYIINSTIPAGDRVYCTLDKSTKTTTIESDSTTFTHTFSSEYGPSSSVYPVVLFAYWTSWHDNLSGYGKGKIYSFKYYSSSDTLTREMYPCVRKSDNVPGMYDTVNNVFYTNNGTGDFLYGDPLTVTDYIDGDTFNVNIGEGLEVDSNNDINVKIGAGLHFDSNDAIEVDSMVGATSQANGESGSVPQPLIADKDKFLRGDGTWADVPGGGSGYIAGDGIDISRESSSSFDVTDPDYYFDTNVQCGINGRTFTKYTTEPALAAVLTSSANLSGPFFVGLSETSVAYTQDYDSTVSRAVGSFEYLGYTWYYTNQAYWMSGSHTDSMGNLQKITGITPTNESWELAARVLIDTAGVIPSGAEVISAKIGVGLTFDSNDAIEIDDSIKLRLNCNNEPN